MARQMLLPNAPWGSQWNGALGNPYAQGIGGYLYGPRPPAFAGQDPGAFRSRIGAAIQGLGSQLDPQGGGIESFLAGATGGYTNTQQSLAAGYDQRAQTEADDRATAEGEQDRAQRHDYLQAQIDYWNRGRRDEGTPAPIYDPRRGVMVDPTTGTATPITGLPPIQYAPRSGGAGEYAPQSPAQKMYATQTAKYLNQKDATGAPLYSPEEAAGAAAEAAMALDPTFRVPGFQPAQATVSPADLVALQTRLRASGATPSQILQAVAAHRSAGRARVVGGTPQAGTGPRAAPDAVLWRIVHTPKANGQLPSDAEVNATLTAQGYAPEP